MALNPLNSSNLEQLVLKGLIKITERCTTWYIYGSLYSVENITTVAPCSPSPLPSARQHSSYGDCLEVEKEYYQNSSVLDCVTQNVHSLQHTYMSSSYRFNRLGLSHREPYAVHRGGCLELYYCNMVEWFWCDSSLISTTRWFPSVLCLCWFGHPACKNHPQNDYYVSSGTLNLGR